MSNPTPNYLKVAYWIYERKGPVLGHEVAEHFNLSSKQLRQYINYMVSNDDIVRMRTTRTDCDLSSAYTVISITQKSLDKIQQDPTLFRLNVKGRTQVQCEKHTQRLWSLALGTRPRVSL
ncbi:MAG: hypothetical protein ACRCZ4_04140 [Plesiomonas sp.]|uniref:hypothetical protein n=1 Tax=Plesiomonas sp. TaxID=2486279 RepID=UPI003F2BAE49